ncbi:MAG: transposase [Actinomycetota bacterium]
MGRAPRPQIAKAVYHVNTVGAGGIDIFLDVEDRTRFLRILAYVTGKYGWRCHLYCLMSNHYHLVVTTPEPNIAAIVHVLNGLYARTFNTRHERQGHLFGARYHAEVVETEAHAIHVSSYVPLNPCRAGVCDLPEDWPWSSYAATLGLRRHPWFLDDDWVLDLYDDRDLELARGRYRRHVTSVVLTERTMARTLTLFRKVPGTVKEVHALTGARA